MKNIRADMKNGINFMVWECLHHRATQHGHSEDNEG